MLQALTYCLVATPQATLLAEPATAMPYLLQWLQVATQRVEVEDGLLCSVLAIVSNLIKGVAEDEPLGDIVPTLLVLVERELAPETMEACLDCLDGARGWGGGVIRHKKRVLRVLQGLLDHRKRKVRQAACRCVNGWHLLSGGKK